MLKIAIAKEVDHFADFFQVVLKAHGYEGDFMMKQSLLTARDGTAMFYKADRFGLSAQTHKKKLSLSTV